MNRSRCHFSLFIVIVVSAIILPACSFLAPIKTEPQSSYEINALPTSSVNKHTHPITLLVTSPETLPAYNTMQMAYTTKPYEIAYFSQNRWVETPAEMLQPLIVEALQNTGYFNAVVTAPFSGHYDYILTMQILSLQQNFVYRPATFRLILRAELNRLTTNQVIAVKQFSIIEPIKEQTPYGGVLAANRATQKLLASLTQFCIKNIG